MGTIITQAANWRTMDCRGLFMIHELSGGSDGKIGELRDAMRGEERAQAQLNQIYADRTGKPVEYWAARYDRRDVYMTPQEALADNLIDEIVYGPFDKKRES